MTWPQIQIPFSGGLNESVDERHVPLGELVRADNVRFATDGSADKRYGFAELTPDSAMTEVQRLTSLNDRILAFDAARMWMYNSTGASAGEDFVESQLAPEATVLRSPFTAPFANAQGFSACYGNGLLACAYAIEDRLYCEIYDATTMQLLTPPGLELPKTNAAYRTKIGWLGTRLVVLWTGDNTNLNGNYVDLASIDPTVAYAGFQATETLVAADYSNTAACPLGAYFDGPNEELYLAYKDTTANNVKIVNVDSNLVVTATVSRNVNPTVHDLAVSYDGTGTVMTVLAIPAAPNTVLGAISVQRAGWAFQTENYSVTSVLGDAYRCSVTSTQPSVWYVGISVTGGDYDDTHFKYATITDATVVSSANALRVYGTALASHLFTYNERAYAVLGHVQPTLAAGPWVDTPTVSILGPNGSLYLVELGTDFSDSEYSARWVATFAPSLLAQTSMLDDGSVTGTFAIHDVFAQADGQYITFAPINGVTRARAYFDKVEFNFRDTKRVCAAELGNALHFNGARYDTARLRNHGFLWAPTIIASSTSAGGVFAAAGVYGFCAVYVRTLPDGTVERSAPSNIIRITIPGGGAASMSVVVTQCKLTAAELLTEEERTNYLGRIELYRTTAGGSIFYRHHDATSSGTTQSGTFATISLTSTITDADLADGSHPYLYTTDGTVPATTPPSFRVLVAEDNRLYGVGDDGRTLWFSQQYDGASAPAFCLPFTFAIEDTRNTINAIGVTDGRKVFFTEDAMYILSGQGPSRSNQNSDYSSLQRLPYAVGCSDWRSVRQTDDGLWFQSQRGIEMLTRSLELVPFQELGAKVTRTLATYPYVTSAIYVPEQSQMRFTLSDTDDVDTERDGRTIVFDTRLKRWSIHVYQQLPADASSCTAVSAIFHDTLGYIWAWQSSTDALVRREKTLNDAAPWLDYTSSWITKDMRIAWAKATDLQGWQKLRRVRVLAEWFSAHGIETEIYYDYQTTAESHDYTEAVVTALLTNSREQLEITPGQMKSQALSLRLTDTAPATPGTGRGNALTGIAFEVVSLSGGARNIAAGGRT